ncbi:MAG: hypothetical protein ABI459_08715 [Deltaproteobacteria bacterium]
MVGGDRRGTRGRAGQKSGAIFAHTRIPLSERFFSMTKAEIPEGDKVVDLFGNPIVALRDRRGRPSYQKNKENQDFVSVRAAAGWSQERIAQDMGIDVKTLRKNFSLEMELGATIVDGVILDVLMKRVRAGHVPSIGKLQDRIGRTAPRRAKGEDKPAETPKTEKPGKKELALEAAQKVPDDWGDIQSKRRRPN